MKHRIILKTKCKCTRLHEELEHAPQYSEVRVAMLPTSAKSFSSMPTYKPYEARMEEAISGIEERIFRRQSPPSHTTEDCILWEFEEQ